MMRDWAIGGRDSARRVLDVEAAVGFLHSP